MSDIDLTNYRGIYEQFVPSIVAAHEKGMGVATIARVLNEVGVNITESAIVYIKRRIGLVGQPAAAKKAREESIRLKIIAPKSRPIDMGGIRDQWQHWTPETNAIELGLI